MVVLNVDFDNPSKFYFEGEKLCPKLEVYVEEPVDIKLISVNFEGICCGDEFSFNMKSISKASEKIKKEIYFDDTLQIFEGNESNQSFNMGIHSFNMVYLLPSPLPSSIEAKSCFIRYSLTVTANINNTVHKMKQYFTVVSKVDLNSYANASVPRILWKDSRCIFKFSCFHSGPVRTFVHIPKMGYVPGESITVNAEVRNYNRSPISWVKACLVQILRYNSEKHIKWKRIVAELMRGCILPNDSQVWRMENILIPAIPPSTCVSKGMISVHYKFYFLIRMSWQEKPISLKQDLLIGTVPLMKNNEIGGNKQGGGETLSDNDSIHYSYLEPCHFGPHPIDDENSITLFSPKYPIYGE